MNNQFSYLVNANKNIGVLQEYLIELFRRYLALIASVLFERDFLTDLHKETRLT
jgi:hypothetical protein